MKIIHFCTAPLELHGNFNSASIIGRLVSLGNEVIYYNFWNDKQEVNKITTRHFQMYEGVLNFAESEKVDLVLFEDNLASPEFLYFTLKARPTLKAKIVFFITFREVNRSIARAIALKELLNLPQIHRVLGTTMISKNFIFPENMIKVGTNLEKIKLVNEPFDEDLKTFNISKEEARKKFKLRKNDFVALCSGRFNYPKGSDVLANAIKYIDEDIKIFIHYLPEKYWKDLDKESLKKIKQYKNVILLEKYFEEGTIAPLFVASDICICPHRRFYEYSQSGIPGMAFSASRPIIAPNFYYFNEIVNRNNVGVLYKPEDPKSLAEGINLFRKIYTIIMEIANFKCAISDYIEKSHWADKALEGL